MRYHSKHCQCKHSFRGQKESTLVFATSRAQGNTTTTVAGIFLSNTLLKPDMDISFSQWFDLWVKQSMRPGPTMYRTKIITVVPIH